MCSLYCSAVQRGRACVCHLLNLAGCSCMDYTLYGWWLHAFSCEAAT